MTPHQQRTLSPAVLRLAEDLKIRNRAQATIDAYTYHVARFEAFLSQRGKRLDQATPEDVRQFQLHLLEVLKIGYSSFNQAVCGLRFLYGVTCPRRWPVTMLPFGKRPKTTISRLLGHASFTTTMVYLHVRRTHLHSTPSPLDLLPVRQLPVWEQVATPAAHRPE